jgi:hypothetical protein
VVKTARLKTPKRTKATTSQQKMEIDTVAVTEETGQEETETTKTRRSRKRKAEGTFFEWHFSLAR